MSKKRSLLILSFVFMAALSNVQANLLSNAGFESGLTGWDFSFDAAAGFENIATVKIRSLDPFAYEGDNYIYGFRTDGFSLWQDIDLLGSGVQAADIDAGNLNVFYGGWQSGWNNSDIGQISIHLLDGSMIEIGSASLAGYTSDHVWQEQSGITDLLSGTRFLRYEFTGVKNFGDNNDAYLDAAFLDVVDINISPVPVPAALWLFGSGLIGLVGLSRRMSRTQLLFLQDLSYPANVRGFLWLQ